ncbi:MAG TPA: nucleotidyltransferase family protein [Terriglobia bacterium]|nr:nucleotidyltransferase family protein [Terriglobia bacterium]
MKRLLRQAVVAELAATRRTSFGFSFWHSFDESDWRRALDWMDVSGLALYFWDKVKTVNAMEALPLYVQARLARSYEQNRLRVESIRKESETLNRLFDDAGVQFAVLKGLALVPDYCPDPTLRTQYDHDYLIHLHALSRAEAVLQRAGYRPKVSREGYHIAYFRPAPEFASSTKPIGLYSARLQRPVELHIRLWEQKEERIDIPLPDDFMRRSRKHSGLGLEYQVLCDEDSLIFQVLHAFRHVLQNWCRLSVFLEISYFLQQRALDFNFWRRYEDRGANLCWVPEASTVVFSLSQRLFRGYFPVTLKAQVDPKFSATVDKWIESFGLPGALENFRNNKNSLFLHREFVRDQAKWSEIRRRRLFPIRRPHQLPYVLFNHGPSGWKRRLTQYLHGLRRLKFHVFSAIAYAWEYPSWQSLRKALTHDQPKVDWGLQTKVNQGNRVSELSLEPVVTQLSKTSALRD